MIAFLSPSVWIALALTALVSFGTGYWKGGDGPRASLATLKATVRAEEAVRADALAQRRAEDERANRRIREMQDAAARDLAAAESRATAARGEIAKLAAKLRSTPAGGCLLPPDARRVFDRPTGGGTAARLAPAADREAAATGGPAAGADAANDLAARERDAAPVDCVTVFEVGARNTLRAAFNADALDACNADSIAQWQACTGKTYQGEMR